MSKEAQFCTADELAKRLRVTKATIYRMAWRGEIPYYSIKGVAASEPKRGSKSAGSIEIKKPEEGA